MEKRKLGNTGVEVGAIGLGCMSFGGVFGATNEAESFACLDASYEAGLDFLDTANVYGNGVSETVLGRWISSRKPKVTVATKGGIFNTPTRHFKNDAQTLRASLEESLKRLGIDHVDLFYVHRREAERPIEEVTQTLADLVAEGKAGAIGFSEIAPSSLRRAAAVHPVAAVQSEYSLWSRAPELGLVQACAELGTSLVAFSPVGRGMLTDKPPHPSAMEPGDFRRMMPRWAPENFDANLGYITAFQKFARSRGWTTAATAMAWVLDQGEHILPIPGTRTAAHLGEWIDADKIQFTDEDRAEIARILPVGWAHGDRYNGALQAGVEFFS